MKKFILWGNGPCVNRGCEAILRSTVGIVSRSFPNASFISCHGDRSVPIDETLFRHPNVMHRKPIQKKLSPSWLFRAYERLVGRRFPFESYTRSAQAVLALGGDNFSTDYHKMPLQYFSSIKRAYDRRIPFVLWGASTGYLNPEFENSGLAMLGLARLITVRESISYGYLQAKGLTNIRLVADPAFVMRATRPSDADIVERFVERSPVVGVNLSPLYGRFFPGGEIAWQQCCAEILSMILKHTELAVLLIPHVFKAGNNDEVFMRQVMDAANLSSERILLLEGYRYNAEELKWIIGRMDYFIGTRTHATVAAFSQSVPTVSLGYSIKARGINQDIFGHTHWVLPAQNVSPTSVLSLLVDLMQHTDEVKRCYRDTMPAYLDRAWQGGMYLKSALNQNHRADRSYEVSCEQLSKEGNL